MTWTQATWLAVGALALVVTAATLLGRDMVRPGTAAVLQIFGSGLGMVLWILWSINSFYYEVVTETGTVVGQNSPALGLIGAVLAFVLAMDMYESLMHALGAQQYTLRAMLGGTP